MAAARSLRVVGKPDESTCDDPFETLVPEGSYEVGLVRWEQGLAFGSSLRWYGHFKITQLGEHFGKALLRVWPAPKARVARSSNIGLDYMAVVGRRPPARGLKPHVFLSDCVVRVKVVTVKTNSRREKLPKECWYSKIDAITGLLEGTPPCLGRGRPKP
jgi:hypothetical protein